MRKASGLANQFASNLQGQINAGMVQPAKQAKFEFKDVARIVQGIIISKAFYSGLNGIRRATDAVWEFSKQVEYAQMVYSNLFGNSELAAEFINVLKDFAAVTPFSFKQSEDAAKRLLAYGIEYKNVMYVMEGVLAAATVQGKDAIIEPISRAFGQIYTKGRLMNEEMRQLAEAGIPAYEILQEKLGLTQKQLQSLGRTAIPASKAINALVDGINERFGTTLQYASMTTQGIISNIKDNASMLFAGLFEPLTDGFKNAIASVGTFVSELRQAFELKGVGGVFEKLIPPELLSTVRLFIGYMTMLWDVIKTNVVSAFKVFRSVLGGLMLAFNALAPIILSVLGVLSALGNVITSNATLMKVLTSLILAAGAAWLVYRAQAIAAALSTVFIKGIIIGIKAIITALNFLLIHPIWALLAIGIGLLVGLTGASDKFRASINKMFGGFRAMGGLDTEQILLPESKKRAADLGKFNEALDGTGKGMDELAKKTGKAAKAAKGLLGFDEVFALKSPDEGNAAPDVDDLLGDLLDMGAGGLDLSGMNVEMPNVGDLARGFIDNLIEALGGGEKLLSTAIGALLGAAIGGILGGPLGAQIGALLGGLAGWFWDEVANALGLTDIGKVAIPLAAALGAAIGGLFNGPLGALIGGAIGALVGWIIDRIAKGLETGDWTGIGLPVGIGLGAAIGFLINGPGGAIVGAAIGGLIGWIVDQFINGFTNGDWNVSGISVGLGVLIGGAIGMVINGPAGAVIGASIGGLIGWIVGLIVENWSKITDWFGGIGDWFAETGNKIGEFFVGLGSGVGGFFDGIATGFEGGWGNIVTWLAEAWNGITTWFSDLKTSIATKAGEMWKPFVDSWKDTFDAIEIFLSDMWTAITTVFGDIVTAVVTVGTDIWTAVTTVATDIFNAVSTVLGRVFETVSNIFLLIFDIIVKVVTDIWTAVSEWFGKVFDTISEIVTKIWSAVSEKFQAIWSVISEKLTAIWTVVSEKFQAIWTVVSEKLTAVWNVVSEKFQAVWNVVSETLTAVWNVVSEKLQAVWSVVSEKLSAVWTLVSEKFQAMWTIISEKLNNIKATVAEIYQYIWNIIKEKVSGAYNSVKEFFTNMYTSIKTNIDSMYTSVKTGVGNIYTTFKNWLSDMWSGVFSKLFDWIDDGIDKIREFFKLDSKARDTDTSSYNTKSSSRGGRQVGHALGGVFNREHTARFAEGNKAEAIIPLENDSAMQPFVDAVANGITASLMPIVASISGSNNSGGGEQLRPLYVGTLIADERGLKELNRKMNVIQLEESTRRG